MAISFRTRLLIIFIALLGVVIVTSTVAVLRAVNQTAISNAERELLVAERVFDSLLEENTRQLRDRTALLAEDFAFRQAIATNEEDTILSALGNHGDRISADLIMMMSPVGEVLISTHDLGTTQNYLADEVLRTQEPFSALAVAEALPFQIVMVPVRAPQLIAWVGVGFEMDNVLINNFRNITNTDVTLLFRGDQAQAANKLTTLSAEALEQLALGNEFGDTVDAYKEALQQGEWLSREKNLLSQDGQQISLLLSVSLVEAAAAYSELQAQMMTVAVIVLILAAVASVFIASSITKPIKILVSAARRIAKGDYQGALELPGDNEFNVLGDTLTQMQTDIRVRESRITFQAEFDLITGLPNRNKMAAVLKSRLVDKADTPFSVLLLKITNFETLSDVYGVAIMDRVLKAASDRMLQRLERRVNLGLIANDELLIYAEIFQESEVQDFAAHIQDIFELPFQLEQIELSLLVRIGVVECPQYANVFEDALRRSHIALSEARIRNESFYSYAEGLEDRYLRKLIVTHKLQEAIHNDRFTLLFQPQFNLNDNRIHSAEALIRWHDEELGPMYPDEFIPIAESSGDITLITDWVFKESLKQLASWQAAGFEMGVSINLSAKDILKDDFIDRVIALINSEKVQPEFLMLEVTESSFVEDTQKALKNLKRLYDSGVQLAMDDFGTGFSSLAQLKVMPVHELKIDKSFVLNLNKDQDDQKIVRSTIEMAHHLGLSVIAEGVENSQSLDLLRDMKCDAIQGYHLSRPIKADEIVDWMKQFDTNQLESVHA